MSRPIVEPSEARGLSSQSFDIKNLQRRTSPLPLPNTQGLSSAGWETGHWYSASYQGVIAVGLDVGQDVLGANAFYVPDTISFDLLAIYLGNTPSAGVTNRFGLYTDDGFGHPDALILDSGIKAATAPGAITATISETLAAGWYWGAVVRHGAGAPTAPQYARSGAAWSRPTPEVTDPLLGQPQILVSHTRAGVAGALPDPFGATATNVNNIPTVMIRVV